MERMSVARSPSASAAPDVHGASAADVLGDYWPGIQIYYPPVKYAPSLGIYEDLDQAAARFRKHAWNTTAHTLLFDLEDGCRQKEMSRELLRRELPAMPRRKGVQVAVRINPFRTDEYDRDLELVRDLADHFDAVILAKAGEAYGAPEIRDLSAVLAGLNHRITIQPIIEHPKSLKISPELMQYATVKHVVFGIHDFSKAMGIQITPQHWIQELKFFLHDILFEARIAGKGVIGAVETLIGASAMPDELVEPDDVRRWLDLHGDEEARIVYKHALVVVAREVAFARALDLDDARPQVGELARAEGSGDRVLERDDGGDVERPRTRHQRITP